jgi:hypothetical protein
MSFGSTPGKRPWDKEISMALTADREYQCVPGSTAVVAGLAGGADTIYKGSLLKFETDGYVEVADGAASSINMGIAKKKVVCLGAHAESVEIETGQIWIPHTGAAQTDVGTLAYCVDDEAIDHAAQNTSDKALGLVIEFKTGYLLVDTNIKALG